VPDVWHIHNHSLGKNDAFPGLVSLMAESREPMLLQMHDFAEDGRPENFARNHRLAEYAGRLYPAAPQIHYAVLNERDRAIFQATLLNEGRLHLLSNPVEGPESRPADDAGRKKLLEGLDAERLVLYPVRALRRKNLGELLFWSLLAAPGTVFATTLGPTNPDYLTSYRDWRELARSLDLPARFGIAEDGGRSYEELLDASDAVLSTSMAEGFGMAFLEPWLCGKPVLGRDLPSITSDFKRAGLQIDHLYPHLPVPLAWIDSDALREKLRRGLIRSYVAYHRPLPPDAFERALEAISPGPGIVDFGGLDESMQQTVLERLRKDRRGREDLGAELRWPEKGAIEANAETVREHFGLDAYARRLLDIYDKISSARSSRPEYLDERRILKGFLKPENFRLLRS